MRLCALLTLLCLAPLSAQQKPVIAIGGIIHETNTFNPRKTELKDFEEGIGGAGIVRGRDIIVNAEKGLGTVAGAVQRLQTENVTIHPTVIAGPQTIGVVTDRTFEVLMQEMLERMKAAPKLDGILLVLHGTMVTESYPHADAEIVRRVRNAFGPKIPIVVTHDFHANVSEEIVKLSTAVVTYKETPHLDAKERGVKAAEILARTVRGEVRPTQAIVKPPMVYNIVYHNTFSGPLKPIVDETKRLEKDPRFLAVSVPGGYQYADIPAMGPSVVVVTNNDQALADREAKRLADMVWNTRDKLKLNLPNPAQAVQQAIADPKSPIVLMDPGDNIGGGSPGDSTLILAELVRQKAKGWVFIIADSEAVDAALKAGISGNFDLAVGGKTDKMHGQPIRITGKVKSLHDGRFIEPEVRHGGVHYWEMGLTAVIEADGGTQEQPNLLMLTRKRIVPFSLHQLISCGIYPQRQHILVAKGTIAPLAAYQPIAAKVITVDSGGVTAVNPAHFTFKKVKPGTFGLGH